MLSSSHMPYYTIHDAINAKKLFRSDCTTLLILQDVYSTDWRREQEQLSMSLSVLKQSQIYSNLLLVMCQNTWLLNSDFCVFYVHLLNLNSLKLHRTYD